ncbi:MAG: M20/M25/M40 family metallo-hydrolase [Rhodobacterales bacterium]|nr:M20/M25/M40 family metallo-hydrolase [Rhodobacterales bacterium]
MKRDIAQTVADRANTQFDQAVEALSRYLRIPAISCDPTHHADVRKLAAAIRDDLHTLGLKRSRILDLPDALPCVAAEWMDAGPDAPTILIYGHMDLQPVEIENWRTDPHEPTVVGDRLYARGAADDMGGWVSHMVSIDAWLKETGGLPCNVKLLIEGEEEIGSPNLERFMDAYPEAFVSDVMVLTDCENPSTEVPGLTVSLRGLLEVELICEALDADGHSGLWGGMVPDVSIALMKLVSRLADDDGRMKVGRRTLSDERRAAGRTVPMPNAIIRKGAHLIDGVNPLPVRDGSAAEWMWWQPSITVVATTLPTADRKKNALRRSASATLSVRLAPDQNAREMYAAMEEVLLVNPPGGVKVTLEVDNFDGEGWMYTPQGPAFPAADRAYVKAWGKPMVQVGVGGSIPFVALFGRRFGNLPLILNGVMDPESTAHGPNESMHLGVFRKAIQANVFLMSELAAM